MTRGITMALLGAGLLMGCGGSQPKEIAGAPIYWGDEETVCVLDDDGPVADAEVSVGIHEIRNYSSAHGTATVMLGFVECASATTDERGCVSVPSCSRGGLAFHGRLNSGFQVRRGGERLCLVPDPEAPAPIVRSPEREERGSRSLSSRSPKAEPSAASTVLRVDVAACPVTESNGVRRLLSEA